MQRIPWMLLLVGIIACACIPRRNVQCTQDTDCDLAAGGTCLANDATGNLWCTFPDGECGSGRRWETLDVGDGVAGVCVGDESTDGGTTDAAADTDGNPNGPWLRTSGSIAEDKFKGMAIDATGNVFVVGSFEQTFVAQTAILVSAGMTDGFVLKYSPTGDLLWARKLGASGADEIADVAIASDGNPIVVGAFSGTVDFGGVSRTSMGGTDQFLAKLGAADGATTWVTRQGVQHQDTPTDIAVSSEGSIAVTGMFEVATNLGGTTLTDVASALGSIYIAKFRESDGTHVWSRAFGGNGFVNQSGDVAFLGSTVYVAGSWSGTGDIGQGNIAAMGPNDAFVAVLDGANGTTMNSFRWHNDGQDVLNAIAPADTPARFFITGGYYNGPASFGGATLPGVNNLFVAGYLADGSHLWSKDIGNSSGSSEEGSSITVAGSNVIVGATLAGVTVVGGETIMPMGRDGAAIVLSSSTGDASRAFPFGVAGDQSVNAVLVHSGRLIVAGYFVGAVSGFGTTGSGTGLQDVFVGSVPLP